MTGSAYDRRRQAREHARQRALLGETLAAYHARENAKPPTLAEVFARNRADKTRCDDTVDLFTGAAGAAPQGDLFRKR